MLPQLGGKGTYNKWFLGCCAAALIAWSGAVEAGTLDRLRQDNTIRIAYRRDAPPFSYQNGEEKPTGFIVDLCQAVVKRLSQHVNIPSLNVIYVPVTGADRFDVISQGKADLL
jgi:glutamate/aspartate transport system substrate-binding protein